MNIIEKERKFLIEISDAERKELMEELQKINNKIASEMYKLIQGMNIV
jgi:hypothetical protein